MKYYALHVFVIFEKAAKISNCRLLQKIGGALRVKNGLFPVLLLAVSQDIFSILIQYL